MINFRFQISQQAKDLLIKNGALFGINRDQQFKQRRANDILPFFNSSIP